MLLSRAKITSDGRLVTKDGAAGNSYVEISPETGGYDISVYQNGNKIKSTWKNDQSSARQAANIFADYYRDDNGQSLDIKFKDSKAQDSITEGSKIVVNTENHVNESAIAVTINESDCLVRFENGDEETVPIESISAFESMANDGGPGSGVKGHQTQNSENSKTKTSPQKALQIAAAKQQVKELHEKAKKGQEIDFKRLDQLENFLEANKANEDSETNSQIEELTKNMDAARARGYDTSAYKKEIARLKSKDAANSQEVMAALKEQYGEEKGEQVFLCHEELR